MSGTQWTESEKQLVRDLYSSTRMVELSERLGRSRRSIKHLAARLEVRKRAKRGNRIDDTPSVGVAKQTVRKLHPGESVPALSTYELLTSFEPPKERQDVNKQRCGEFHQRVKDAEPKIAAWREEGLSHAEMAPILGVSKSTFYSYLKEIKRGKE